MPRPVKNIMKSRCDIIFLSDVTNEEMQKVFTLIANANRIIDKFFGIRSSFDIVICRGSWEMEVQVISRKWELLLPQYDNTKCAAITDYRLKEIIIRYDAAKFGDYLRGLILGTISNVHTQQLREGLAWYFTLELTKQYKYLRPSYPQWVEHLYLFPVKKLAQIVGNDFLKDFTLGRAVIQEDVLPNDIQELFLPEKSFYASKRRYYKN